MSVQNLHPELEQDVEQKIAKRPAPRRAALPPLEEFGARSVHRRTVRPVSRFHSRFVASLKVVLPVLALALLALLAAWPSLTEPPRPQITADKGQLEMIKPRYYSVDEQNQPFSVTAAEADQSADQPGIILLDQPEAEMTELNGTWVTMRSDKGWYNQETGILKMRGHVRLIRDDGNEFTTPEADVDVKKGTAWGDAHVEGQGPDGVIDAEAFRMTDRGKTITFLNQSTASVQTSAPQSGAPQSGAGSNTPDGATSKPGSTKGPK
ncbi:LPS export ABC transporter periplasmic protein LptC [Azospirillum sp. SYSU D00513]|uniref:LPS export ABC transporter periplasmic protein LptC n=1 Tax=Azospirillum sp. SYSU D00513 TaxID=2812561 RepID=UPI001A9578BA|nr:LPS export ABC transporter periplasmic protein LptC [Azospirillum sp. SYSU D00513]